MTDEERLRKNLKELERVSGLRLSVADGTDVQAAAEKTAMLLGAWKERYSRAAFLRNLCEGTLALSEAERMAHAFRIPVRERRALFVIDLESGELDHVLAVFRSMLLAGQHDLAEAVAADRLVMLKTLRQGEDEADVRTLAETIVDMAGAEAMARIRVGYGRVTEQLADFPESYREASLALEIGRIFYSGEYVISYGTLGAGRLIYALPEETCRAFLDETLGEVDPADFDEETLTTIETFYANNLNISETARQLYLHRNTLVYRLEKLRQATGLDLRVFDDAMEFRLAMMVSAYLRERHKSRA